MQVKIINSGGAHSWYRNNVGRIYTVSPYKYKDEGVVGYTAIRFGTSSNKYFDNFIHKEDVEVVLDEKLDIIKEEKQEKGIKISYREVPDNLIRIIDFKLLRSVDLPQEYLFHAPYAYYNKFGDYIKVNMGHTGYNIIKNSLYKRGNFDSIIEDLKKCGSRLGEINKQLKEKRSIKTIII